LDDQERRPVVEEHFLDEALDTEAEQKDDEDEISIPWSPEAIRVSSKSFSLRNVLDMIDEKELELAPDFQRNRVWNVGQKSRLIESMLLQIPLPAFYFAQDRDGAMKVVDGLQRLSTVYDFARGDGFPLKGLEYLVDEQGSVFADLSPAWRRRFYQTQLYVHVIDPQTPSKVKYDIFRRINTGGTPLNTQEIRHCMSGQRSRTFLRRCANSENFLRAVGERFRDHVRMADRKLVLRFCAFRVLGMDRYEGAIDPFLDTANELLDDSAGLSDDQLSELAQSFEGAMALAYSVFRENAFRKWPMDAVYRSPVNRALFESWSIAFAEALDRQIRIDSGRIVVEARELMTSDFVYLDSITTSTGGIRKVIYRFNKAREVVFGG
jgi:hypothetical protein